MCLRKLDRIAIWNRKKIVVVIVMAIWTTDFGFIINGEYLLQISGDSLVILVVSQVSYG